MKLKAIVDNKTLGITKDKIYSCWTLSIGNYSLFKVDENDNGDAVIAPASVFERVELVKR